MRRPARRYVRTLLIGTFCLAALVWMAVRQFGVSPRELLELFLATGLVVLMVIGLAGGTALVWVGLRKRLRDRRRQ
jgi:Zn-dependent protease